MTGLSGNTRVQGLVGRRRRFAPWWMPLTLWMVPSALITGCGGCSDSPDSAFPGGPGNAPAPEPMPEGLLELAIDALDRRAEFPSSEMLQQIVDQLNQWAGAQEPLPAGQIV